ncbi:MAG TPA: class I adenylate-forming enzyme family protein, partial [Alphaproteobacteria bacterium]|nr:class I adenylate-forming enzyme family protein [Alphaproteobacteria bacterium]
GQPFELSDQVIEGVPLSVYKNLPPNISHLIVEAARFGDRTFLVNGDQRLSYAETLGRAQALANWLAGKYGAGLGQRVAIASRNSPEWIIAFLAIQLTGATSTLINSRGTAEEIAHALADTDCNLVIADRQRAEAIAGRFAAPVIVAEKDGNFRGADGTVADLTPAPVRPSAVGLDDPAIIMFTSGTTGRPKGAVLSHRGVASFLFGMRHNGATYLAHAAMRMGVEPQALIARMPQMATLAVFPFFHVSGASAMLMGAVINGGKMVMMDRWNPAEALKLVALEKVTMLQGPPSIFWDVIQCPEFATADITSVTNVGIGGQATPPNLLELVLKHFPTASPGGGFGQTETNGSIASGTGAEYLANRQASGRMLPGCEARIVDENGQDLPLGSIGEIWSRSPLNMIGYWNQPEANAAVFKDGWLKTGDIGFLDADRFITIVDRKKDVIIRGGENIYCAELERVFQQFPGVLEVAAFGAPDDRWGERVVLAVVAQPDRTLSAQEMLAFGAEKLAAYKVPAEIVFSAEPFVRNAVGKIDKPLLRRGYAA